MTLQEQERFYAILAKSSNLLQRFESLRQECWLPDHATQVVRGASFKARLLLGVVLSNVTTALYSMRKGQGDKPPAINPERDFMTFDEFITGYAGSEGLRCRFVADGFMSAAEVLLDGAEAAAQSAELLLRSDEATLITLTAPAPAPFKGILSGLDTTELRPGGASAQG